MMVTDPIADMFMRLRNAGAAGKAAITVPHSDIKL
ncbi:MAG TPA: 30S ribosomal protein S8, partial [Candidatus Paceibacterota bacterium]|nr:30S ribosomal protein S8 [Candidatus Paceibacterota bacterium]